MWLAESDYSFTLKMELVRSSETTAVRTSNPTKGNVSPTVSHNASFALETVYLFSRFNSASADNI
jgi:hypothetical protein